MFIKRFGGSRLHIQENGNYYKYSLLQIDQSKSVCINNEHKNMTNINNVNGNKSRCYRTKENLQEITAI